MKRTSARPVACPDLVYRVLDTRACRKAASVRIFSIVPPAAPGSPTQAAPSPCDRVRSLVARQARVTATRLGADPAATERQTLAEFDLQAGPHPATAFGIRGWAREKAEVLAASAVVRRKAFHAAALGHRAERAGTTPDDVAQEVTIRFHKSPPRRPWVRALLLSWAGTVSCRLLVDGVRRGSRDVKNETNAELDRAVREAAGADALHLLSVARDWHRIGKELGAPDSSLARLFELLLEAPDASGAELAEALATSTGYVHKLKRKLRRKVTQLWRMGLIDLQPSKTHSSSLATPTVVSLGNGAQP